MVCGPPSNDTALPEEPVCGGHGLCVLRQGYVCSCRWLYTQESNCSASYLRSYSEESLYFPLFLAILFFLVGAAYLAEYCVDVRRHSLGVLRRDISFAKLLHVLSSISYVGGFCLWINMWKEKEAFHAEYMLAVLTLANALSFLAFALSCYSWIGRVSASNTLRSHRPFTRNVRIATLFAFFVGGPTIIFGIVLGSKSSEYELFNFISIAGSILPVIIIAPLCLYLVLRLRANQALAHPSTERLRAISQKSRILPIPCLLALVIAIARLAVFGCLSMEEPVAFLWVQILTALFQMILSVTTFAITETYFSAGKFLNGYAMGWQQDSVFPHSAPMTDSSNQAATTSTSQAGPGGTNPVEIVGSSNWSDYSSKSSQITVKSMH